MKEKDQVDNGKRKKIFRWVKVIVLIYCLIGIGFYYLQDYILFHPEPLSSSTKYQFNVPFDEINIPYNKETVLNIVRFKTKDSIPKGVVLYFHGNQKNIAWYEKYSVNFTKNGYEVWMMDYPGFGKSKGEFKEQALYDYALQFYKLARSKFQPTQIVIYGKSFGTCLATELASIRDCKYLILEAPCYSMSSLVSHYMPIFPVSRMLHYHFPNNIYIKEVTAPILIMHGTSDGIIPYGNAKRLFPLLKPNDQFIPIEGGSHNDLSDFPKFHQALDSLLH
jgi:uncharacterized protein